MSFLFIRIDVYKYGHPASSMIYTAQLKLITVQRVETSSPARLNSDGVLRQSCAFPGTPPDRSVHRLGGVHERFRGRGPRDQQSVLPNCSFILFVASSLKL
jgi:hypothetical protein